MYPSIVDMNENESSKYLRMLELDAFANVLAAVRAQGPPTAEKLKLLKEVGAALRIPQERCKAEIRKVILDERLNTIAYFSCGQLETSDEWIKEGRRLISLLPRVAPQTIYSAIADEVADAASISNEQLPLPAHTDRKRSTPISQVQCNVPESSKSQQFRIPDAFKNEEIKKRKLPFGVENSSLAQHLITPSKVSRIQQIYRQKVKAAAKEDQLKLKTKQQEPEQPEFKHINHPTKVLHQQHFQQKMQKVPLSIQSSTSASPKINILQNISIQPPNRGEETIEQIKNEINSFIIQKSEQSHTSPQPSCSNENQAPKQQKQTIVNIKPNPNITYKHVSSPGPSSELQKSLKVCSRKPVTKTIPGQKLIIVSNAQSIATSSILQRTLTIPFVKNISVKNFDKFKIVSTSTTTANLQLTSLTSANTNTFTTNSAKHKVVTVRTNPTTKKMIPLAHLHALNAKGSIKVLPVGGKILTKTTATAATTSPLFIMNNVGGIQQALTKSTSSTSVVMTCRPQESVIANETKVVTQSKNEEEAATEDSVNVDAMESTESTNSTVNSGTSSNNQETTKSSVLADILKASGVISSDNEQFSDDIESQITQLTAIPQTVPERIMADEVQVSEDFEIVENSEMVECHEEVEDNQNNGSTYILLGKDHDTDRLLKDLEGEDSSDVVIGSLDPGTGEYTIETSVSQCEDEVESTVLSEDAYMVEVQKTTSMPDINAIN